LRISQLSSEELASRLILSVINYKENENKLDGFPYVRKGSFAILAQVCVGNKNDAGQYTTCLTVTESMLNNWGVEKKELFEIAAENSRQMFPTIVQQLSEFLGSRTNRADTLTSDMPGEIPIADVSVITNVQHFNGAATMFYDPGLLDRVAEQRGTEKLILMPSSINQIYCFPYDDKLDSLKDCRDIYADFVNLIGEDKCLADNLLIYDKQAHQITELDGQSYGLDISSENVARNVNRNITGGR
jgi:hypothetical protein